MKAVEIQVNEKTFKLGYGLEVFMNLGELWGLDTLEEVNERFQVLVNFQEGKTSLSNLKMISEVVEAMTSAHPDNQEKLTAVQFRSLNMDQFQTVVNQLINGFVDNMPKPPADQDNDEAEKKPKAQAKNKNL